MTKILEFPTQAKLSTETTSHRFSADGHGATNAADEIPSAVRSHCFLCGNAGRPLYRGLRDRLFGAPGTWDFSTCGEEGCGLVWLNPAPLPEHLGKAYANYYTHQQTSSGGSMIGRMYRRATKRWLSRHFGYPEVRDREENTSAMWLECFLPAVGRRASPAVAYLPFVANGALLDVGCGTGTWLAEMRYLGWNVQGVDFDPAAVEVARTSGLDVRCGSLEEQRFAPESFDAIHLCHVIEHVPDPLGTVAECARLLRPGGKLVIFTPNISSFSHQIFGQDWRGLEPPRHLHIFSPGAMSRLLAGSAFTSVSVQSHVGTSVTKESYGLRRQRKRRPDILAPLFRSGLFWRACSELQERLLPWFPSMGETLAVVATRQSGLSVAD